MTNDQKKARKRLIKRRAKLLARLRAMEVDEPVASSSWDLDLPESPWLDA